MNLKVAGKVRITEPNATFAFLGFDFRWSRSPQSGKWYPRTTPRKKKVLDLHAKVRACLDQHWHLSVQALVAVLNPILRGWVNYFRSGNSGETLSKVRQYVERRVRRFAAKQRKRHGFGWKRWSSEVVYNEWGLQLLDANATAPALDPTGIFRRLRRDHVAERRPSN